MLVLLDMILTLSPEFVLAEELISLHIFLNAVQLVFSCVFCH